MFSLMVSCIDNGKALLPFASIDNIVEGVSPWRVLSRLVKLQAIGKA